LGFKAAQEDAKKLDQEVSEHLEKQERKRIEDEKNVLIKIEVAFNSQYLCVFFI